MQQIERVHFIGIAGSGMSGLAIMAKAQGLRVSGSDRQTSKYLDAVLAAGIPVSLSQSAENVADPDIDIVVVSTAIHADNPELLAARQRGLVIWPRAQMLAWLGQGRQTWAVAGTHGKTTTSSMLASALLKLGCDPSFVIGGVLNEYQTTAHLGLGQVLVIEADESDESFMMFSPQLMILTNIEADHMDHYHSLAEIEAAFARFMTTLDSDGLIVYCCDDQRLDRLIRISGRPAVSYGFSPAADYRCLTDSAPGFTVRLADGQQVSLELPASPGQHNVLNATAVLAALIECGFTPAAAAQALSGFQGVKRRFELIGEARGVQVVDDYGHHPTEIKATLAAARQLGYQHVHLLFQPHRFTRTSELFDDFVEAFHDADSLALLDIYTAGEDPISGVSSRALAAQINALHPASQACLLSREAAPAYLARLADAGDLILTLGAGDVTLLAPLILEELAHTSDLSAPNLDTTDSGAPAPHVSDTSNPSFNAQEPNYSASSTPESSSLESSTPDTQSALIFEAYCELEGTLRGTVQLNEPMARHTSFRIGGPAGLYIECASLADLNNTLKVIKQYQLAWTVIGKGTNLLVSDRGFAGAIITLGREFKVYQFPDQRSGQDNQELTEELPRETQTPANTADILVAGAGVQLGNLVQNAFKNGYSGLEFAVGIPGTLGGALYMNAGSVEEWIGQIVSTVLVLLPEGGLKRYSAAELDWAYRSSGLPLGEVILEAELMVSQGNASHIRARMEGVMKRRQKSQPLNKPNAGSIFRNPPEGSAGQLIDSLGLKGLSSGDASISEKHANFIVNNGRASAADVLSLIQEVVKKVRDSYGLELQTEIRFIGF